MDTNLNPVVTVLIAAFNAENYISETIESVLNQTFKNFELLIVDDGSTDRTYEQILKFSDDRIHIIKNEKNEGLISSLNRGIVHSKAKYIARLDADDIALPTRIEKQVAFMEANLDVGLCGSFAENFGTETGIVKVPITNDEVRLALLFSNCFVHSSVIMRRSILSQNKLFYHLPFAEDNDLWCEISRLSKVCNIPEVLVRCRMHKMQITKVHRLKVQEAGDKATSDHLSALFADTLPQNEFALLKTTIIQPVKEPEYAKILGVLMKINPDKYNVDNKVIFLKALRKKIILRQMRATKKYRFNDFVLIVKYHLCLVYKILGFRYTSKLLLCTLIAKRRK